MSDQEHIQSYIDTLLNKKNIFLTGAAGVGKSYTTNAIVKAFESQEKVVVKLASTAMAATHIGGQTLHSFFDLRLYKSVPELLQSKHYKIDGKLKKVLKKCDLIVIDEISMVSSGVMDLVHVRLEQSGFNGALLVVGDFLQLAPVFKKDEIQTYCKHYFIDRPQEIFSYAFHSTSWKLFDFQTVVLKTVYRTKDSDYMLLLDDIRRGIFGAPHAHYLHALFEKTYTDAMAYTFLFATNADALAHNQAMLKRVDAKEEKLAALFEGETVDEKAVESFLKESKIAKELVLKVGADVLFTKNSWNYFNGERGTIVKIDTKKGKVSVQKSCGTTVTVERERFEKRGFETTVIDGVEQVVERVYFSVLQFPFALAYAITIHKAQGMGIEDLVIDTHKIFAPSQFYVALSRAISPHRLILQGHAHALKRLVFVDKEALRFYKSQGMV